METITQIIRGKAEAITNLNETKSTQKVLTNKLQYTAHQVYAGLANMIVDKLNQMGQKPQATPSLKGNMKIAAKWLSMECDIDTKWLMLYGGCGTGKSTLLYAIDDLITKLQLNAVWRQKAKFSSRLITARELNDKFISDRATFNGIKNYHLLMIDDLGTEPRSIMDWGNEYRPLVEILTYRYEHRYDMNLATIFTTNLDPDDIGKFYDNRIDSRLWETATGICFEGQDFRKAVQWTPVVQGCPF